MGALARSVWDSRLYVVSRRHSWGSAFPRGPGLLESGFDLCEEFYRLRIIEYPHPTLRHESKPLKRVDAELVEIVREMFALMYANKGIGLAANQVDLPYRLFIANLTGDV